MFLKFSRACNFRNYSRIFLNFYAHLIFIKYGRFNIFREKLNFLLKVARKQYLVILWCVSDKIAIYVLNFVLEIC